MDGKNSSLKYWDDGLTDDELDKICGVYKVATGIYSFNTYLSLNVHIIRRSKRAQRSPNNRLILVAQTFYLGRIGPSYWILVR